MHLPQSLPSHLSSKTIIILILESILNSTPNAKKLIISLVIKYCIYLGHSISGKNIVIIQYHDLVFAAQISGAIKLMICIHFNLPQNPLEHVKFPL